MVVRSALGGHRDLRGNTVLVARQVVALQDFRRYVRGAAARVGVARVLLVVGGEDLFDGLHGGVGEWSGEARWEMGQRLKRKGEECAGMERERERKAEA